MSVEKIEEVSDEQWNLVNPKNRKMAEEFLRESVQLSPQTLKQYSSAIKIYFLWVKDNLEDKNFYDIKSRDFLMYQNFLVRRGLSSAAIRLKRSVISSFNGYIELYYQEEYPMFRNYINKKIAPPPPALVRTKEPPNLAEIEMICEELEKQERWQLIAYLRFSFSTGARRNEVRQLLKEVVHYEPKVSIVEVKSENGIIEKKESRSYITHIIRCKGRGIEGKKRTLQFDEKTMKAIKKWLEIRGEDDCPYVFVIRSIEGNWHQVAESTFNIWSEKFITPILGRRFHPHAIREARATSLVIEQGKDIKVAQKLLGHESSTTTEIYVINKEKDDSDEAFLD